MESANFGLRGTLMTWSIIARHEESGDIGVALASPFFAIGAYTTFVASGAGAIVSQGIPNPYHGIDGIKLLRAGRSPEEVVERLIRADEGANSRQVHLLDVTGQSAAYTGSRCSDWSGDSFSAGASVAGDGLEGPNVLSHTLASYLDGTQLGFARRLIGALRHGQAAGGDRHGIRSAALVVFGLDEWSKLDLRVDDHPDPIAELERLDAVSQEEWTIYRRFVPTRTNPVGETNLAVIDAAIGSFGHEV
jgi:uncharacterized Ntn-hydrolase superfamily protein